MDQLSKEHRRFVAEQLASGRYASEAALLADALEQLRHRSDGLGPVPEPLPLWGVFREEPELVDQLRRGSVDVGRPVALREGGGG
jgi:hypothetical protein